MSKETKKLTSDSEVNVEMQVMWQGRTLNKTGFKKISKDLLAKAILAALADAYTSDVIDTDMEQHIIGKGKEYGTKEDWKICKLDEWLR